jgi:hypothetical protein
VEVGQPSPAHFFSGGLLLRIGTPCGGSYFRDQFYEIYNNSDLEQIVAAWPLPSSIPLNATRKYACL